MHFCAVGIKPDICVWEEFWEVVELGELGFSEESQVLAVSSPELTVYAEYSKGVFDKLIGGRLVAVDIVQHCRVVLGIRRLLEGLDAFG